MWCSSTLLGATVALLSSVEAKPTVTESGLVIESSLACLTQSSWLAIQPSNTPSGAVDARRTHCPSEPTGASESRFCSRSSKHNQPKRTKKSTSDRTHGLALLRGRARRTRSFDGKSDGTES